MTTAVDRSARSAWAAALSVRDAVFDQAPRIAALLAIATGACALIATVIARPPPMAHLPAWDVVAAEWPEFLASVASLALMALALGLRRRLDAAWAATVALLGFFAFYAALRHDQFALSVASGLGAVALGSARRAFYRHARLTALFPSKRLHLAIAAAMTLAALGGLLWAAELPGFAEAPWWALFTDPGIGRPGRILGVAAAVGGGVLLLQALITPARPRPQPSPQGDQARAAAILAVAEDARPEAHLARLGDKTFLFTADGSAFVMAAPFGGSLIAMGGPVGPRACWRDALGRFRQAAEEVQLRPVVYAAPPDLLPDLLDCGFSIEKIGEAAVIPLERFTLSGKAKQDLRTSRRRLAEREGASYEVETFVAGSALAHELEAVSQAWLTMQKGGEKSFSLGRFAPEFLGGLPVAVVRIGGRAAAFGSLWTTADGRWAAIDLMRYDPARAPPSTMDFLITETLLWAQREGFHAFDLGLAPLSGLSADRHAPLFAKFGRLIYARGGALYNFEGLRRFKEKFGPTWEPRYIAAPGAFAMPIVLAEVALLTSGGPRGLLAANAAGRPGLALARTADRP